MLAEQGLVGRDDIFSRFEQFEHNFEGRVDPPHQFDRHLDLGIVDHRFNTVGQNAWGKRDVACLFQVADDRFTDFNGPPRPLTDSFRVLGQNLRDASPDVAQSDDANLQSRSHKKLSELVVFHATR